MMYWRRLVGPLVLVSVGLSLGGAVHAVAPRVSAGPAVLQPETFRHYVDSFNQSDDELYKQHIPNSAAWEFLKKNIPLFECPDKAFESTYYFRWWTYRKHIKHTPDGYVITEFLPPVDWGRKYNTICCAAGHHIYEGRWLHDSQIIDDYSVFWFRRGGSPRLYSFWAADAVWARFLVAGNERLPVDLLPDLIRNYKAWESGHYDASGLFWQHDGCDGMELSIGGSGCRATINSYMYGGAIAIAKIAELAGQDDIVKTYREKAARIKQLVEEKLWDKENQFFKVLPRGEQAKLADVRELHGYTPWYFNLPDADKSVAWRQLMDPNGFYAPFGPPTAERRHPKFDLQTCGFRCQWNGPSWPYSTAVTLVGMANLLNNYRQDVVNRKDYFDILGIYTKSHRLTCEDGRTVPWIDEYLNPLTGKWIIQTRSQNKRGKDYNHSSYCDLIISGLVGLRPRADATVEVNPLLPEDAWDWFCLDNILYHGHVLTILYDRTGEHYQKGKGLLVFADGKLIARRETLQLVKGSLDDG